MFGVIDVGSNTVRLLLGECRDGILQADTYKRQITRLAGGISDQNELSAASMQRTLDALKNYATFLSVRSPENIRIVATAALRRAVNRQDFIDKVFEQTDLIVEVIDGKEEARLMTQGVLSVLNPVPECCIVIDIGGGSTEFVLSHLGCPLFQRSYPMGVVQLCEEMPERGARSAFIQKTVESFLCEAGQVHDLSEPYQLVGTAGTITTLAAIDLQLSDYDASLINNHVLSLATLNRMENQFRLMTDQEKEQIVGMEPGRGDLILPGLEIVLQALASFELKQLVVSDAGLLEGTLLELCR